MSSGHFVCCELFILVWYQMLMKECCYLDADDLTSWINRPDKYFLRSDEKESREKHKAKIGHKLILSGKSILSARRGGKRVAVVAALSTDG